MKFLLKVGTHHIAKKIYKATDPRAERIIETDKDLELIFGSERFEKIEDAFVAKKKKKKPAPVIAEDTTEEDDDDPEDSDDDDDGDDDDEVITYKPKHRGGGRYDVLRLVDDVPDEDVINDEYLTKKEAAKLAKKMNKKEA